MNLTMRSLTVAFSASIFALATTGCSETKQETPKPQDNFDAVYQAISADTLKEHTKILSSDKFEGR